VELIKYLNDHYFTKQELLEVSKVTEKMLRTYQENKVMPKCSYKLKLNLECESFFGLHGDKQEIEYYAKGYSSWLAIAQQLGSTEAVYSVFSNRYKAALATLHEQGHVSSDVKITSGLNTHIKEEWSYFLDGVYGLCTKSGLPEDIAAKELSILEINALSEQETLSIEQHRQLVRAVNLLDSASSLFAPHERLRSSRHRLVDEVRRRYQLPSG